VVIGLEVFYGDDKRIKHRRYNVPDDKRQLIKDAEKKFKPFEVDSLDLVKTPQIKCLQTPQKNLVCLHIKYWRVAKPASPMMAPTVTANIL